jgi:hypothetical protein
MRIPLIALFILTTALFAQPQTGGLHGILTDSSGAVIPAASLTLSGGGGEKSVQSQTDGSYTFSGLAAGDYKIAVVFPGFVAYEHPIAVQAGATAQFAIQLTPTGGKQEVTVNADAAEVSVEPGHNASAIVIKDSDLDSLPDDPGDLSDMLNALAGPSAGPNGATMMVDGFAGGQLPPKNTIKEIRMNQNPFSSEYDDLGFGRIEIITKPGTDTMHGQFQLTDSDSFFNSRNPYAANKADYVNRSFNETLSNSFRHKGSWTLNATQNKINNNAIIHAVTLDPSTLESVSVNQSVTTPRDNFAGTARMDYQLTSNQTATARYTYNRGDQDNSGIGGYSLVSRAYSGQNSSHELQLTETAVLNPSMATETHFGYSRYSNAQFDTNTAPAIIVSSSFNDGGAQVGKTFNHQTYLELQNISTLVHGAHTLRFGGRWQHSAVTDSSPGNFGGTFTFLGVSNVPELDSNNQPVPGSSISITSLEQYRRTLLFQKMGYPVTTIQALGGGASQFSIAGGNPEAQAGYATMGVFIQDDWRIRPNLTISPGFRYEMQTGYHDPASPAPRIGLAWSPDGGAGKTGKTVIRLGAGFFYDRFGTNVLLQTERFNGINQQQYLVMDPLFYPVVPALSTLEALRQPPVTWRLSSTMKPLLDFMQAATLERQLPRNSTFSITFLHISGKHVPIVVNANTPLPGTFDPANPSSGVRPYGNAAGNIFEYQSNGVYNQKLAFLKWDARFNKKVSFTTYYTLRFAHNDANWLGTPSNPFDLSQDYGRASYDRRHSFNLLGNITLPLGLQFSPMLVMSSGAPYDLTIGSDLNGDSYGTDRPAFATDLSRPSVVVTKYGAFDTNPMPGQTIVPRNYLQSTGMWNVNARLGKTFAIGKKPAAPGSSGTETRFKLNFNVDVNNVFNHLNQGGYVGNLSSPLFGQSTSVYLFRETSNLRRVQFGTSFTF